MVLGVVISLGVGAASAMTPSDADSARDTPSASTQPSAALPTIPPITTTLTPVPSVKTFVDKRVIGVTSDGQYAIVTRQGSLSRINPWHFLLCYMRELLVLVGVIWWARVLVPPIARHIRDRRRMSQSRGEPVCPQCGYQVTGITEPRCPECGSSLSPTPPLAKSGVIRRWSRRVVGGFLLLVVLVNGPLLFLWGPGEIESPPGWSYLRRWLTWPTVPVTSTTFWGRSYVPLERVDCDEAIRIHLGDGSWWEAAPPVLYMGEEDWYVNQFWLPRHDSVVTVVKGRDVTVHEAVSGRLIGQCTAPDLRADDDSMPWPALDAKTNTLLIYESATGKAALISLPEGTVRLNDFPTDKQIWTVDDGWYVARNTYDSRGKQSTRFIKGDQVRTLESAEWGPGELLCPPWVVVWRFDLPTKTHHLAAARLDGDTGSPESVIHPREFASGGTLLSSNVDRGIAFVGNAEGRPGVYLFDLERWAWLPIRLDIPLPNVPGSQQSTSADVVISSITISRDGRWCVVSYFFRSNNACFLAKYDLQSLGLHASETTPAGHADTMNASH